ncbi:MAG: IS982 family transposase, partial [Chloroflexi bacterium]
FNRRRRNLMQVINRIRQVLVQQLEVSQDRCCVIDSLPIPVVPFHLVRRASRAWHAHGATFGKVMSKQLTIFGYKLQVLVTLRGIILDFELAPANERDLSVGVELLAAHTDLTVYGDKGYLSAPAAAELLRTNRVRLLTLPRTNQNARVPAPIRRTFNVARQIIETVNSQLADQFRVERNHAHTFWGLCARLYTKLTAHTLCVFINRLLGKPDFLQIKGLAFPA